MVRSVKKKRRLAARMEDAGLSATTLARRTGVHVSLIYEYGNGLRVPSLASAAKIADALDCERHDIISDSLHDRWELAEPKYEGILDGRHPIAMTALADVRALSLTGGSSDAFRKTVARAGRQILKAIEQELEQ